MVSLQTNHTNIITNNVPQKKKQSTKLTLRNLNVFIYDSDIWLHMWDCDLADLCIHKGDCWVWDASTLWSPSSPSQLPSQVPADRPLSLKLCSGISQPPSPAAHVHTFKRDKITEQVVQGTAVDMVTSIWTATEHVQMSDKVKYKLYKEF